MDDSKYSLYDLCKFYKEFKCHPINSDDVYNHYGVISFFKLSSLYSDMIHVKCDEVTREKNQLRII